MTPWIKTSDRLPEEKQDVLFTLANDTLKEIFMGFINRYHNGQEEIVVWIVPHPHSMEREFELNQVTHWMPLPEYPEE